VILCDTEIRAALRNRQLVIDPEPPAGHITTSAVDLRLGREFRRWRSPEGVAAGIVIDPSRPDFYRSHAAQFLDPVPTERDGSVIIRPGELILGITHERVELPEASRLAARVEGRSALARLGLGVHVTAPTIHAGFRGQITLEITHQGPAPIMLRPEVRICQLIVEQVFGTPSSSLEGIFQDQTSVAGKPMRKARRGRRP
jgi:dCTP deaminase